MAKTTGTLKLSGEMRTVPMDDDKHYALHGALGYYLWDDVRNRDDWSDTRATIFIGRAAAMEAKTVIDARNNVELSLELAEVAR